MKFQQRVPNWIDIDRPEPIEFNTIDELMEISFIKEMMNVSSKRFKRLSISDNILMAEYEDGYRWWALGYIYGGTLDLPKWEPKYTQEELDNRAADIKRRQDADRLWWKQHARPI